MSVIIDAVRKIVETERPHNVLTGIVQKTTDEYCSVREEITGKMFFKVAYNALLKNGNNRILVKPKQGTSVVFIVTQNNNEAYLVSASDVESIDAVIDNVSFEISGTGYKIEANSENLKDVISDYIDELNKIVVLQGTSINVAATTLIKTRLLKILK